MAATRITVFQLRATLTFIFVGLTKLLVGLGGTDLDSVEVVNLDGTGQICSNLPDYPIKNSGAVGHLINGSVPMICGGVTGGENFYNHCECYALVDGSWIEVC